MAHDKKSSIRAVYNHVQHLEERRKIMQAWADFLDLLRGAGEVIDFRTSWQQIEKSMSSENSASLDAINKQDLIRMLINIGVTIEELKLHISQ